MRDVGRLRVTQAGESHTHIRQPGQGTKAGNPELPLDMS